MNNELAKEAEVIARRMAKAVYGSEGLWELFLLEAYDELTSLTEVADEER